MSEWVRTSKRLPAEKDANEYGDLWVWDDDAAIFAPWQDAHMWDWWAPIKWATKPEPPYR